MKKFTNAGGITEYALHDHSGRLLQTWNPTLNIFTNFFSLNGKPIVEAAGLPGTTERTVRYLHADLLGSPRMATSPTKSVLWYEHFDPYGKKLNNVTDKIGYTAHAHDQESGYTYMQARFYDAQVGRFLSTDPIHFVDDNPFTFNRYSYANNNPYRYTDPTGMAVQCDFSVDCDDLTWQSAYNTLMPGAANWGYAEAYFKDGRYGWATAHAVSATAEAFLTVATAGAYQSLSTTVRTSTSAARGTGKLGSIITSKTNSAGGTVVTASGRVVGSDFAGAVNSGLMRGGPVNILSGAHGEVSGVMRAERAFFDADRAAFGHLEGVNVLDITRMTPGEISGLLRGPGTTIGAFCESGVCLAPFR